MIPFKNYNSLQERLSLEYHDTLNPKIWDKQKLKPEVRKKLLDIGKTWQEFAKIPDNLVQDITLTGGNANYNYTDSSDLDVHIIIDRNELNPDRALVDEYLQDKKILWSLTHNIHIYGYPIELYAQDVNTELVAGGVYSLLADKWIKIPVHGNFNYANDENLENKAQHYMDLIDKMIESKMDVEAFHKLKKKISDLRSSGLKKGGEFSFENLLFKELRNRGYLDKMNAYERSVKDKELSLD